MSPQSTYIFMLVVQLTIYHQVVLARQDYYMPRQQDNQQMMLDDLDNSQETQYYNDLKKTAQNDPNFLTNWPYLRELLPPNYDTSTNRILNFEDRIPVDEILPNPLPLQKNIPNIRNSIKDQSQKKNSNSAFKKQYMHACHFKICNMGRKRNARFELY